MDSAGDKLVHEGLTVCWHCGTTVKGRVALRGPDHLSYMICDCPKDGVHEFLMGKGALSYLDSAGQKVPALWPRWEAKAGSPWEDGAIANRENLPVLVFGVTTECNSSCKICSFPDLQKTPSLPLGIDFIKEKIALYKGKEVVLCGGEATMREDLPELIKAIRSSGNIPVIQTNGLRLADREYLRKLKKAGLDHVRLSFDGFKEEIYERVRGGRPEYGLKLRAIDNLVGENVRISITSVIIRGVNEEQVGEIINFAARTKEVTEVAFLCFFLTPMGIKNGFTINEIPSSEDIMKIAAGALDIAEEDFILWDRLKMNAAFFMERARRLFRFLPVPVFRNKIVYFKRNGRGIFPLLTGEELARLSEAFENNKIIDLMLIFGKKFLKMVLRNCFRSRLNESLFYYDEDILKISVASPLNTHLFSDATLTSFGFYNSDLGQYNSVHQRFSRSG